MGGQKQIPWLDAIKDRLAVTSTMIKGMKGVKMLGLSDRLEVIVAKLRASEISAAFHYRLLMSSVIVVGKLSCFPLFILDTNTTQHSCPKLLHLSCLLAQP